MSGSVFLNKFMSCLALLLSLMPGAELRAQFDLESLRFPAGTQVVWIGREINHNGVPMSILAFESQQSVEDLINHFRIVWSRESGYEFQSGRQGIPAFIENRAGSWRIISRMVNRQNIVVQARLGEQGSATGYVSVLSLDTAGSRADVAANQLARQVDIQIPADLDVLSATEADEENRRSTTLLLFGQRSARQLTQQFNQSARQSGWQPLSPDGSHADAFIYVKKHMQLQIGAVDFDSGSALVALTVVRK